MTALFSAAIFLGAFLVFLVQPLFARLILPLLGGSPAVWNTSLLFFQASLLAGYAYADIGTRRLGPRLHAPFHVTLLLVSLAWLPIGIPEGWVPPPNGTPVGWTLFALAAGVGVPFTLLAATAPLLQAWFARVRSGVGDPYVLYATSNLGSLLALAAFPLVLEPALGVGGSARVWGGAYVATVALIAACAVPTMRRGVRPEGSGPRGGGVGEEPADQETGSRRAGPVAWVVLSFVPSSLLLGVTSHLSTDVAAFPLLWVVPLALYLLTFVVAFSGWSVPRAVFRVQPVLAVAVIVAGFWGDPGPLAGVVALHLSAFFVTALALHGRLAGLRPPPASLTVFYLHVALGGALGGAFNALLSPVLFDRVVEYGAMLAVGTGLAAWRGGWPGGRDDLPPTPARLPAVRAWVFPVVPALALGLAVSRGLVPEADGGSWRFWVLSGLAGLLLLGLRARPVSLVSGLVAVVVAGLLVGDRGLEPVLAERNFFGTLRVVDDPAIGARFLYHGTTVHGARFLDEARSLDPITYYDRRGPLGDVFPEFEADWRSARVGVVGLGTGNLACWGRADQEWIFYELDPDVARIARNPALFGYLDDCPPVIRIRLGDARLTLAEEAPGALDLLVVDAFSSDAIPVHLLTREAFRLYRRVVGEEGVILLHVSNRYVALEPVLEAVLRDVGMRATIREHRASERASRIALEYSSDWVFAAASAEAVSRVRTRPGWRLLRGDPGVRVWTDDHADVVGALEW